MVMSGTRLNLESLSLWFFDLGKHHLHFDQKLNTFELMSAINGSPTHVSFDNLQKLKMKYQSRFEHEWIQFFYRK